MEATLDYMPNPEHTNITIVAYSNTVQFFTFANEVSDSPSIIYMNDANNPFTPLPASSLLLNLRSDRAKIDSILGKLASLSPCTSLHSCGPAALFSSIELLRESAGKVLWFLVDVPSTGFGALKSRVQPSLYNSEKEHTLFLPDGSLTAYAQMSQLCLSYRVAVDVFACAQTDIDLATISSVSAPAGGEVHYYHKFNATTHGEKLHFDIFRNLTRFTVYDVSFNVRCSVGLSVHKYYGGFGETFKGPVTCSAFDADKTFAFTIRQDEKLKPGSVAHIQLAVLYSTGRRERKVRVLNYSLNVTDQLTQVYSSIDLEALLALETRLAISTMLKTMVNEAREKLCQDCISILTYYRKTVSTTNASVQFVLPESLKTYPLLLLGLLRTPALSYIEDFPLDQRVASLSKLQSCSFPWLFMQLYPRMYKVSSIIDTCQSNGTFVDEDVFCVVKPANVATSGSKMNAVDAYLVVGSEGIYLYLPESVSDVILGEVFGKSTLADVVPEEGIPVLETEGNVRLRNVIEHFRREMGGAYQQLVVAPYNTPQGKHVVKHLMVEDSKNPRRELAYIPFLSYIHKMILSKLQTF